MPSLALSAALACCAFHFSSLKERAFIYAHPKSGIVTNPAKTYCLPFF
jgi:hypothetical protein